MKITFIKLMILVLRAGFSRISCVMLHVLDAASGVITVALCRKNGMIENLIRGRKNQSR